MYLSKAWLGECTKISVSSSFPGSQIVSKVGEDDGSYIANTIKQLIDHSVWFSHGLIWHRLVSVWTRARKSMGRE
jgi:hypothetical protein